MKRLLHWLSLVLLLAAHPAAAAPDDHPDYRIALSLDPAAGRIAADVTMQGLVCNGATLRLWLNRDLAIDGTEIDGRRVVPRLDPPGAGTFWLSQNRAIDLPCPRRSVRLRYTGPGRLHPDGRNQVSAKLIELSLYGGWYPLASIDQHSRWQLTTRLPPGWLLATPGAVVRRGDRVTVTAARPSDIVLLAAPGWRELPGTGARVLLAADAAPAAVDEATHLGHEAGAATEALIKLLGVPEGGRPRPELVFTLRPGPASYARLPLIVTPQAFLGAIGGRSNALNIRHETGHFWSRASGDADDWINEGLAEYLAVRRTGDVEGAAARAAVIAGYRREVTEAGPGTPIAGPGAEREYINRYLRPALLFDAIEQQRGRAAVDSLLRAVLAAPTPPTTAGVVAAAEAIGAGEMVRRCLAARDWPAACGGTASPAGSDGG